MKPIFTRFVLLILLTTIYQAGHAQYTITASINSSSFGAFASCPSCSFTLLPGVIVTVNSDVSCSNCTFGGAGTIKFQSGTVTLTGTCTFNDDTVIINEPLTVNSMNFSHASITVNKLLKYNTGGTVISNSHIIDTAGITFNSTTLTGDTISTTKVISSNGFTMNGTILDLNAGADLSTTGAATIGTSTIDMNGTGNSLITGGALTITNTDITMNANATLQGSSLTVTGGSITSAGIIGKSSGQLKLIGNTLTMTGGSLSGSGITTSENGGTYDSINMSGAASMTMSGALSMTNTNLVMSGAASVTSSSATLNTGAAALSGAASLAPVNAFTITSANLYLNGNSTASAGTLTVQTNSYVQIGDGSIGSSATLYSKNEMSVLTGSNIGIANNNNSFSSNNNNFKGGTAAYSIQHNTVSCGSGGTEHACTANTVFGCATMNASGALGCVVLALADIDLTAKLTGDRAVTLVWTDNQNTSAAYYLVQRSNTSDQAWTTIATIDANGYTSGDEQYEDASAPEGTDEYRIARVGKDGTTNYSATTAVTIAGSKNSAAIYPNPATGHQFFVTVPNTGKLVIDIYSMTGQLLQSQTVEGQLQYQVSLPSQLPAGSAVVVRLVTPQDSHAYPLLLR